MASATIALARCLAVALRLRLDPPDHHGRVAPDGLFLAGQQFGAGGLRRSARRSGPARPRGPRRPRPVPARARSSSLGPGEPDSHARRRAPPPGPAATSWWRSARPARSRSGDGRRPAPAARRPAHSAAARSRCSASCSSLRSSASAAVASTVIRLRSDSRPLAARRLRPGGRNGPLGLGPRVGPDLLGVPAGAGTAVRRRPRTPCRRTASAASAAAAASWLSSANRPRSGSAPAACSASDASEPGRLTACSTRRSERVLVERGRGRRRRRARQHGDQRDQQCNGHHDDESFGHLHPPPHRRRADGSPEGVPPTQLGRQEGRGRHRPAGTTNNRIDAEIGVNCICPGRPRRVAARSPLSAARLSVRVM